MLESVILSLVMLSLATSAATLTITRASLFKGPREWIMKRSPFWGKLVSCPYCMAHWVALMLLPWGPTVFASFLNWLATIGLSAIVIGITIKLLHWDESVREELEDREIELTRQLVASEARADGLQKALNDILAEGDG